ncbi:MAG: SDR family oxidoreductase [Pseudoruegeria sp.]
MRFQNQSIVITGGNSGIGRAAATAFVEQGGNVAILGRNTATVDETVQELGVLGQSCNVTDSTSLTQFMSNVAAKNGPIDVLFANAGIAEFSSFEDHDPSHVRNVMDVNFFGILNTIAAALPHLRDGASIILTTSIANQMGEPDTFAYAASKAAVKSLISTLSREFSPRKIRVNAISPGPTETPIFEKMGLVGDTFDQTKAALSNMIPAGRMGKSADQVAAILYLASRESSFVMGQEIVVDGGLTGCNAIA